MNNTIGTFCLIKNEIRFIAAHLKSWLPFVDEMVLFDGNSTDGTIEAVKEFKDPKITLIENMDPKDLKDDYVRMFNECLRTLKTDYAVFAHPDMILDAPGNIRNLGDSMSYYSHMRSFAGEPEGQLYEIVEGRRPFWKNVYRLHSPDLGLHYFGHYGTNEEDCYFSKITGNEHSVPTKISREEKSVYGIDLGRLPYKVEDSGIVISHYSDLRTYERRLGRMLICLENQGVDPYLAKIIAKQHPRVTLRSRPGFKFEPVKTPDFLKAVYA